VLNGLNTWGAFKELLLNGMGRTEFIKKIGMIYSYMEKIGIMIPVIEINCKYIQGAKYDDKLIIKT
jgi:acyl-CoA thioesterase FadM